MLGQEGQNGHPSGSLGFVGPTARGQVVAVREQPLPRASPAPLEPSDCLGEALAQQLKAPWAHTTGLAGGGPGGTEGGTPGQFTVSGVKAEAGTALHAEPAILGDVHLGRGAWGTRSWQGLDQGPRGQGRARSPWKGPLALAQVPAPNVGVECHQSCRHPVLHAPGPVTGKGATSPIWPPSRA